MQGILNIINTIAFGVSFYLLIISSWGRIMDIPRKGSRNVFPSY